MSDAFYTNLAIWSQVVAAVLFWVALIVLWRRFITPAVISAQARKNQELADSERRRNEAKDGVEQAHVLLKKADDDVRAIRLRAEHDAAAERERLMNEATNEGKRLVRNAGGELDRLRRSGRETLRDELVEKALRIAREAAARTDAATNRRLIEESVSAFERGSQN